MAWIKPNNMLGVGDGGFRLDKVDESNIPKPPPLRNFNGEMLGSSLNHGITRQELLFPSSPYYFFYTNIKSIRSAFSTSVNVLLDRFDKKHYNLNPVIPYNGYIPSNVISRYSNKYKENVGVFKSVTTLTDAYMHACYIIYPGLFRSININNDLKEYTEAYNLSVEQVNMDFFTHNVIGNDFKHGLYKLNPNSSRPTKTIDLGHYRPSGSANVSWMFYDMLTNVYIERKRKSDGTYTYKIAPFTLHTICKSMHDYFNHDYTKTNDFYLKQYTGYITIMDWIKSNSNSIQTFTMDTIKEDKDGVRDTNGFIIATNPGVHLSDSYGNPIKSYNQPPHPYSSVKRVTSNNNYENIVFITLADIEAAFKERAELLFSGKYINNTEEVTEIVMFGDIHAIGVRNTFGYYSSHYGGVYYWSVFENPNIGFSRSRNYSHIKNINDAHDATFEDINSGMRRNFQQPPAVTAPAPYFNVFKFKMCPTTASVVEEKYPKPIEKLY